MKCWSDHKDTIIRLYKTENLTLPQVKDIMLREYEFAASIRSYRMYLKKWKVRKYRKHAEDSPPSAWRQPQQPPVATPRPSFSSARVPNVGPHLMPTPPIQHPWADALDVFSSGTWADRSPSVSASDYSACSIYDGSGIDRTLPMAPVLGDGGRPSEPERGLGGILDFPYPLRGPVGP